jgi:hypothetical protein
MRFSLILIFLFLCSFKASGQVSQHSQADKPELNLDWKHIINKDQPLLIQSFRKFNFKQASLISSNLVYSNFGFFCKTECRIQKKALIPVKFRLGTLEYVNKLEYNR